VPTKRTTRRALTAAVHKIGATIDYRVDRFGSSHEVVITAPNGKVFAASGVHELVSTTDDDGPIDTLYADALLRVSAGLAGCDDSDCEWCNA
jgi:hypothetical protein